LSEMVDRVAQAICADSMTLDWREYRAEARRAIEAMREPTEAMTKAANEQPCTKAIDGMAVLAHAHGYELPKEFRPPNDVPLVLWWKAMIDAAVKE
jgi:hypothetical protein